MKLPCTISPERLLCVTRLLLWLLTWTSPCISRWRSVTFKTPLAFLWKPSSMLMCPTAEPRRCVTHSTKLWRVACHPRLPGSMLLSSRLALTHPLPAAFKLASPWPPTWRLPSLFCPDLPSACGSPLIWAFLFLRLNSAAPMFLSARDAAALRPSASTVTMSITALMALACVATTSSAAPGLCCCGRAGWHVQTEQNIPLLGGDTKRADLVAISPTGVTILSAISKLPPLAIMHCPRLPLCKLPPRIRLVSTPLLRAVLCPMPAASFRSFTARIGLGCTSLLYVSCMNSVSSLPPPRAHWTLPTGAPTLPLIDTSWPRNWVTASQWPTVRCTRLVGCSWVELKGLLPEPL